jgi:hypothetical protein
MTPDEAMDVLDGICPCLSRDCPDSDPIRQYERVKAQAVLEAEDWWVEAQIDAYLEARAFGEAPPGWEP